MSADARLEQMQLELPPPAKPMGLYRPLVVVGGIVYVSGHGPLRADGTLISGRVGETLDQQEGYAAARQTGLAMLATLQDGLGQLDRIKRLVKTVGLVQCTAEFDQQPAVINGFSELMAEVFGRENGIAARSALGTNALPSGIAVEIEAIFELNDLPTGRE
jgi:enamine deaminase RidA (YjgF/YER057c/UK114 family)